MTVHVMLYSIWFIVHKISPNCFDGFFDTLVLLMVMRYY